MPDKKTSHDQKDTKHRIMNIAAELFTRDGYYKVSVREICDSAGVSKPVLYYYFRDKEALLEALMEETHYHADELKNKYFSKGITYIQFIRNLVSLYSDFVENFPHLVKFSALIQTLNVPQKIKEMKLNRYNTEMNLLIEYIKIGQDSGNIVKGSEAKILAQNLIGTIIIIIMENMVLDNDKSELREKLNDFAEFWIESFLIK